MSWSIGQKVLCVDDVFPPCAVDWYDHLPIAGHIYTIRAIQIGRDPLSDYVAAGFLLEELLNPRHPDGRETGFFHTRFVPWAESSTESKELVASNPA